MRFRWCAAFIALGVVLYGTAVQAATNADYLALRAKTSLTTFRSSEHLENQFSAHAGQVIELQGNVNGVMTMDEGIGVMLHIEPNQTLIVSSKVTDSDFAAGNIVRVMARIPAHGRILECLSVTIPGSDLVNADLATLHNDSPPATTGLANPFGGTSSVKTKSAMPVVATSPYIPVIDTMPEATRPPVIYYQGSGLNNGAGMAASPETVQQYTARIKQYNGSLCDDIAQTIAFNILDKSARYGIDPRLLFALVAQESRFNPYAVSRTGARGLGQLMPGTAALLGVNDSFDIEENLDGSARYLAQQLAEFGDNSLALAAYNAGPAAVRKYRGVPPYRETQRYVQIITRNYSDLIGVD